MTDRKPPESRFEPATTESNDDRMKRLIGEDLVTPLTPEEIDWLNADLDKVSD